MKSTSLFALVVAILVGFTVYDYWSSQKKEEVKEASEKIVRLDKDGLKVIEVGGSKNSFRLEKVDNHWTLTKPYQESADQQAVLTYIEQLFGEKSVSVVAENPDLAKYGLAQPLFTLHLVSSKEESVKLGSVRAYDNSLYAQIDQEPKVLLVNSSWDVMLSKLPSEFRDTKLYHGDMKADFESIKVTGPKTNLGTNFEFSRENDQYVLKSAAGAISQQQVQVWLEQIKALRGAAFVNDPQTGFKPETTILLKRKGSDAPFLLEIAHDRAHPEQFEVTSTDLSGGLKSRVLVSPRALEPILLKPEAFYDTKAPFAFDPKLVAEVKFTDHGKTSDTKVDPKKPDPIVAKLSQLEAVRFLGPARPENKYPSHLTLLKSDGSVVFEMSWGEPIVEKAEGEKPEARYLPVKTSLSKQIVGVPEKQIATLAAQPGEGI